MKKIAIIGCAGSGKTTLALKLSKLLNLPVYHLDQYYWKPNWERPVFEDFQLAHNQLCDQDEWIIEGIYTRTLEYRFFTADCIIFLNVPRRICFWRVFKRAIKYWGIVRPSAAMGCPEKLDFGFLKWIWNFPKNSRPIILKLIEEYKELKKICIIRSDTDQERILEKLKIKSNISKD